MRFVIIGAGVAGFTAAMDLARRKVGEVIVFSDEPFPYYYRPQLTRFLAGELPLKRLIRRPLYWYWERGIDLRVGSPVEEIDPVAKTVRVLGRAVSYDRLLIATGSRPFVPPIPGVDKAGVLTWRTLEDTIEITRAAFTSQDLVVIGGGLLGLEAARGLRGTCKRLTVLEYFPRLLPRQLDLEGATLLQHLIEEMDIRVVTSARVKALTGDQTVSGVELASGEILSAQAVIIAAGVRCHSHLAKQAGIAVDQGIIVDEYMHTNVPDIYAAGDVAVYRGQNWALATIAQAQGATAAANMAGESTPYKAVIPATSLKVAGVDVTSIGLVNPQAEDGATEIRALDHTEKIYRKIVLQDGVIVGAILVNDNQLAKELENRVAGHETLSHREAEALITR